MHNITINPAFFEAERQKTGLSRKAFIQAMGISEERYQELIDGGTPTLNELAEIQLGFNLDNGIPVLVKNAKKVTDDQSGKSGQN